MSLGAIALLGGCKPSPEPELPKASPTPTPRPTPTPTPTPVPTPVQIPFKKLELSKLFNGLQVQSSVEAIHGENAASERSKPESYTLDIKLKVRVPPAKFELAQLSLINPQLPRVLPTLESLLQEAKVSRFFESFYGLKVASLQRNLTRLDQVLSRHNFYDCETILEIQHPESKRRALLIQADMDIDMDGSDSDRVPLVDGSSAHFQPMTSYKWAKKTTIPNGFLASREAKLVQMENEFALKTSSTASLDQARVRELKEAIPAMKYEVSQLKKMSFLVSATDPYVVLPGSMVGKNREAFTPQLGDYCVVIFEDKLYPAIIGDVGPTTKMGEASLRIGKEINPKTNAYRRSDSDLKVTYLVFPNSAEKPWNAPDLKRWHERCEELLKELGGFEGQLHVWEDLIKPPPTPTPIPVLLNSGTTNTLPAVPMGSGSLLPSISGSTALPLPLLSPIPAVSPTPSPTPGPGSSRTKPTAQPPTFDTTPVRSGTQ